MTITREDLEELVREGVIDADMARRIAEHAGVKGEAEGDDGGVPRVTYYLGAGIVMAAMGWFLNEAWLRYGGWALGGGALFYGASFWGAAESLRKRPGYRLPRGLLVTLSVWTVPLVVFGVQDGLGLWPGGGLAGPFSSYEALVEANWLTMELGLVAASAAALRHRPTVFLNVPLIVGLWFVCADLSALAAGIPPGQTPAGQLRAVSLLFGGAVIGAGFLLDRRTEEDHAFWLYLLGLLSLWIALTSGGVDRLLYPAANLALLAGGVLLGRRTFLVFGAVGVFVYLAYLSNEVFAESLLFPVALTAIGIGIMSGGLLYREHRDRVEAVLRRRVPDAVRAVLPPNR